MTTAQRTRIDHLVELLDTVPGDVVVTSSPDLPPRWVAVTIGTDKGRPKHFDLDPDGIPHQ